MGRPHWVISACWLAAINLAGEVCAQPVQFTPTAIVLDSPESSQQLLVSGQRDDGSPIDLTRVAACQVRDSAIATIDDRGVVRPKCEGRTEIVITPPNGADVAHVSVDVRGLEHPRPLSFTDEIVPILTKSRCNSGGCHGKAEGQHGFKLSVFGFDPAADHAALVKESRGRRVLTSAPDHSLLLLKATSTMPHGGARKIEVGSLKYRRIERWIAEGAQFTHSDAALVKIDVEPQLRSMRAGETQQLLVTAIDSRGFRRCVTAEAEYETNAELIASVDSEGLIAAGDVPGEAVILVRYRDQVSVCRVTHPHQGTDFVRPPEANFVDHLVFDKLQGLGIPASELADDATFLRRVCLDTIGTLPTPDEVREFLADGSADKRARVIAQLLNRDEYADYWAQRWADLLRVDQDRTLPEGAVATTRWLRRQIAENRPYDEFVTDIVTARGDAQAEGPAAIYKVLDSPEALSRSFSQLFLGVRIECAQCHHHPFERWGQDDYYGLAGFFTGVTLKALPNGGQAVAVKPGEDLKHPRTGSIVPACALGAEQAEFRSVLDRRTVLAAWMTAPENPYFARVIANRVWAHYFGRGLVEPIDDQRVTNPATNEPLLLALEQHMRDVQYDLRAFTSTLLNSRTYQLSAHANAANLSDVQSYSHATDKAMPAEVLLDAISQATGVPEKFAGWPAGYRAIQIWDNRLPSYFLRIFGRPIRASVCECERSNEPSISQALHLMNSPEILGRVQSSDGRVRRLLAAGRSPADIVDELYLATLSRFPSVDERNLLLAEFAQRDSRAAAEDALWALLNTREFLYNH
ncbi:MAG: DUF1549 and DUF1553 domain-containing protein [Planctomycetaceae bacterium]